MQYDNQNAHHHTIYSIVYTVDACKYMYTRFEDAQATLQYVGYMKIHG